MNYLNKIILITIILISIIFGIFYFINKGKSETQTFLPIENNTVIEEAEEIERIIVILNAKNKNEENNENSTTTEPNNTNTNVNNTETYNNETNNITNNTAIPDTDSSSNNTTEANLPYYIKVNYTANVVNIYTKDSSGNYTVPYKAMICSTGTSTPTSGVYPIQLKWKWLALFGDVYGYYTTQIVGNILFHSVPYLEKGNPASLEYWEYDKLGTSASMGCIRLKVEDAMWIYNNCDSGTLVEFYSDSEPGPLGKPSAPKISGYDSPYKDWDPTDPDTSNPWITNPPQ